MIFFALAFFVSFFRIFVFSDSSMSMKAGFASIAFVSCCFACFGVVFPPSFFVLLVAMIGI